MVAPRPLNSANLAIVSGRLCNTSCCKLRHPGDAHLPAPGRTEQAGACPGSRGHQAAAPADRSERTPAHGLADPLLHLHGVRLHLWHDRAARLRDLILIAVLTASVISFFSIPFSGYLSDRIGQGACAIAARSLTITLLLSSRAGARRSSPRPCSPNTNGAIAPSRSDLQLDHHPVRGAAKRLYQ